LILTYWKTNYCSGLFIHIQELEILQSGINGRWDWIYFNLSTKIHIKRINGGINKSWFLLGWSLCVMFPVVQYKIHSAIIQIPTFHICESINAVHICVIHQGNLTKLHLFTLIFPLNWINLDIYVYWFWERMKMIYCSHKVHIYRL
jgi:hypothetical protein